MISQKALFCLSHGLYVIGVKTDTKWTGCVVDAVMQATQFPTMILISCMKTNYTSEWMKGDFSLSVLSTETPLDVIKTFGFQSGRSTDKWKQINSVEKWGLPFVKQSAAYFKCRVIKQEELSTHIVFFCEVAETDLGSGNVITYQEYQRQMKKQLVLKERQENITKENTIKGESKMAKKTIWVCSVCGYVYDGDIPFEELPDDYVCPVCMEPKSAFEPQEED